jgi:hypothetical protein
MTKVTDTAHARTFLQVVESLRQAGWNIPDHQVLLTDEPMGATVYFYDAESSYRHFSIFSKDGLSSIRQQAAEMGITPQCSGEQLIEAAEELIGSDQATTQALTSKQLIRLHVATGHFVHRTYALAGRPEVPAHTLILLYRNAKTGAYALRLSAVMTEAVLNPEEVEYCALRLLEVERMQYPERFEKVSDQISSTNDAAENGPDASPSKSSRPARKPRLSH